MKTKEGKKVSTENQQDITTKGAAPYDFVSDAKGRLGEFESDEEYGKEFERIHGEYGQMMDGGKKLTEAIQQDPRFGEIISAGAKGDPVEEAIIISGLFEDVVMLIAGKELGSQVMKAANEYMESNGTEYFKGKSTERKQKVADRKAADEEYDTSVQESVGRFEQFAETNMKDNPEKADRFVEFMVNTNTAFNTAKWSDNLLAYMHKAFEYDEKMAEKDQAMGDAVELAEKKGKNAKIEEKKVSSKKEKSGDGMPGGGSLAQNIGEKLDPKRNAVKKGVRF